MESKFPLFNIRSLISSFVPFIEFKERPKLSRIVEPIPFFWLWVKSSNKGTQVFPYDPKLTLLSLGQEMLSLPCSQIHHRDTLIL